MLETQLTSSKICPESSFLTKVFWSGPTAETKTGIISPRFLYIYFPASSFKMCCLENESLVLSGLFGPSSLCAFRALALVLVFLESNYFFGWPYKAKGGEVVWGRREGVCTFVTVIYFFTLKITRSLMC